jgi:hypothetical protein
MTAKDGRVFEKMIINMPGGTKLNGVDVAGWSLDRFMSDTSRNDKANGHPVTLTFKPDTEIELFKGKGEKKQTISIKDPWTLAKALKASRDHYISQKEERVKSPAADQTKPSAAVGRSAEGNHIDMTGKNFNIPYEVNGDTRYANVKTDGIDAWNISADSLDIGRVTTNAEGYYVAYSKNRPEGIAALDPISAARQAVADSGIATRVPGESKLATPNHAPAPAEAPKTKKSFLEQMNQVTREKFPDKKFGDDVTKQLGQLNQEAKHHGTR